jgi:hypothetical protein
MKIRVTISVDKGFWDKVVEFCEKYGHTRSWFVENSLKKILFPEKDVDKN